MPRVLRNFLIAYVLVLLFVTSIMIWLLSQSMGDFMTENSRDSLNSAALVISEHIHIYGDKENERELAAYLKQLAGTTNLRYTLIDVEGEAIADSTVDVNEIKGLSEAPELLSSTAQSPGFSNRYSKSGQQPMLFLVAQTAPADSEKSGIGYIRVGKQAHAYDTIIQATQRYFWSLVVGVGVLTVLMMMAFASITMKPLSIFSEAARRIGVGQYEPFPSMLGRNDEWRSLADAFRGMQTEMQNRESRLVKNRDRLQAVLSSMIEGVVSVSPELDVMIVNRAACRMLDVRETEFRGRKLLEVVRNTELAAAIDRTQKEQTFSKTEFQVTHDMNRRTIAAMVSVLPNEPGTKSENDTPGVVVVLNDITELRQLENMRRDFVANVSHELKTPLASIKAYAETLKLGAINDEERKMEFVEQIESQAEFLNQQIQDLLQIARIESGEEVWDIEPIDLNEECKAFVPRFEKLAQTNGLEIRLDMDPEHPQARADAEGLATILNNLISNAISYTPSGGTVTIRTRYESNSAVMEVSDTGIGIAPEHQARIFERFYRVDKARSRDKGGTGLGLSIVKHLAQSFGGSVEIESQIGEGTTFRIRLPKYVV